MATGPHTTHGSRLYVFEAPIVSYTSVELSIWMRPRSKQTLHIVFKVLKRILRSAVDGSLAGWERTAVSHPKGECLWDEAPWADIRSPRIPQRDRAVILPIRWGCCGPNATSLPTLAYASPPPSWLWGRLPWYPGFISFSDELEKKKTCLSLYAHIFFSFTVAAGVLGSAGVWRWFQCAPSSRKFLCCKLVPKMAVLGDETSKGEGLARGLIIGVLPYNWINGSRVLKTPTQSCWE